MKDEDLYRCPRCKEDMCGHDAFLEESGAYECDLGHVFSVRRERKQ